VSATVSSQRLRIAIMALSDAEQNALGAALDQTSSSHDDPKMRAFYAALCAFVDESAAWQRVRASSLPEILDVFGDNSSDCHNDPVE